MARELIVLGASGGCGRAVVEGALRRGYRVSAVLRPSSPYQPPAGVTELRGEVLDPAFLWEVVDGAQRVISCLGQRRAGPLPWAPLRSPPDLVQSVTRHLVDFIPVDGQVVWMSAAGVRESRARLSPWVRQLVGWGNLGVAYRDLGAAEQIVSDAGRAWLAVRPVTLTPGRARRRARPVERYGLASTVRRTEVAEWMLDAIDDPTSWSGRSVLLGS